MKLDWEGCFNVRDLGGLKRRPGGTTPRGQLIRADSLDHLTTRGWDALLEYGVRSLVDLRNNDELDSLYSTPAEVTRFHLPLDGRENRKYWSRWEGRWEFGTPLYYSSHLQHMPERSHQALQALVQAPPGGVLFHCGLGRDRTGLLALLALYLWEVEIEEAIQDYLTSRPGVEALQKARGQTDHLRLIDEGLAAAGLCLAETIRTFLTALPPLGVSRAEFQARFPMDSRMRFSS